MFSSRNRIIDTGVPKRRDVGFVYDIGPFFVSGGRYFAEKLTKGRNARSFSSARRSASGRLVVPRLREFDARVRRLARDGTTKNANVRPDVDFATTNRGVAAVRQFGYSLLWRNILRNQRFRGRFFA